MGKSITVKAATVEEAVRLALSLTGLTMSEVNIEVLSNPRRNLFGFRKTLAEVNVTEIIDPSIPLSASVDIEKTVSEMFDVQVDQSETGLSSSVPKVPSNAAVRVVNKKIETVFSGDNYPVISVGGNIKLYVNGEERKGRVVITPEDEPKVKVSDELIPPSFTIQLIEHDMLAILVLVPGKKVKRIVRDTDFEPVLHLQAEETIEYYNDLKPQEIVDQLKLMGVETGFIFPAIRKVTETENPYEAIVAKGIPPVEGLDGDLEMHIGYDDKKPGELEKVDFRELNGILSVEAGQVIATKIAAIPGREGSSLLGKTIPVKKVRDIIIRAGKNITQVNNDLVATISGRPTIDWHDKLVKIDVNHELHHPGEIDLESGNIRFEGDVRVDGNVHPSMYVGSTGNVYIGGAVTKATLHAVKTAIVKGNVFSSTISVGQQEFIIGELTMQLKEILVFMESIQAAINQVLIVRGETGNDLDESELNHLIRLLLEKKYTTFQNLNREFIQKVKNYAYLLTPEWIDMATKFYGTFVSSLNEELKDVGGLSLLIREAQMLVELYSTDSEPRSLLTIPYAINSVLYCSGDIEVMSKGLYHCSVTAGKDITVQGVCRGGEIIATNKISLLETGSVNNVKTFVKTGADGSITIGLAYAGTEIQVGNRRYKFMDKKLGVFARLDQDGELIIE